METATREAPSDVGTGRKKFHHHCMSSGSEFALCGKPRGTAKTFTERGTTSRKPLCPECRFVMEQQGFTGNDGCPT